MQLDLVLRGGRIVDGTGMPGYLADIGIAQGRIVAIGKVAGPARRVINLEGLVVAPGFIDIHTHYDAQIMWDPMATASCWHGVTTVVVGNCGFTLAPCRPKDRDYLIGMMAKVEGVTRRAMETGIAWDWITFPQFLQSLSKKPLGINIACNVGHSAVRYYVMGEDSYQREATADELQQMREVVADALMAGAIGFTTSRGSRHFAENGKPVPSRAATLEEIRELGLVLGEHCAGGLEVVGVRPTEDPQGEFRNLLVRLSRETGRPVNWNELHYQAASPDTWRYMLRFMEEAAALGARIYAVARCQGGDFEFDLKENAIILVNMPAWRSALDVPLEKRIQMLKEPGVRASLRNDLEKANGALQWERVAVEEAALSKHKDLQGKKISQIAVEQVKDPLDAFLDLAVEERLDTEFALEGQLNQDRSAVAEIIRSPFSIPGISDGGAHLATQCGAGYSTYLLGTWVRQEGVLTIEDAVRKLTLLPANLLGLRDRGLVAEGMVADLVAFDPATVAPGRKERVRDLPGGESRLIQRAHGIEYTIVAGELLLEHNEQTGAFPGGVLKNVPLARS